MPDIDRLIKAWKIFRDSNPYEICNGREFRAIREPEYCMGQMIEDTIAILKEQEAELLQQEAELDILRNIYKQENPYNQVVKWDDNN